MLQELNAGLAIEIINCAKNHWEAYVTLSDLCASIDIASRSSIERQLGRMANDGLVAKNEGRSDTGHKKICYTLTDLGRNWVPPKNKKANPVVAPQDDSLRDANKQLSSENELIRREYDKAVKEIGRLSKACTEYDVDNAKLIEENQSLTAAIDALKIELSEFIKLGTPNHGDFKFCLLRKGAPEFTTEVEAQKAVEVGQVMYYGIGLVHKTLKVKSVWE